MFETTTFFGKTTSWWFFTNPFEKYAKVKLDNFARVPVHHPITHQCQGTLLPFHLLSDGPIHQGYLYQPEVLEYWLPETNRHILLMVQDSG